MELKQEPVDTNVDFVIVAIDNRDKFKFFPFVILGIIKIFAVLADSCSEPSQPTIVLDVQAELLTVNKELHDRLKLVSIVIIIVNHLRSVDLVPVFLVFL